MVRKQNTQPQHRSSRNIEQTSNTVEMTASNMPIHTLEGDDGTGETSAC